ncbi:RNase H-like domain found in reverse transcriptase [Popillia japonica]|uniref:RNase H-like domain found in reverse transcriptase n=1 Tax=Popillia japonica TaxID=7064 RepID=A0AAW1JJD1_POPJA
MLSSSLGHQTLPALSRGPTLHAKDRQQGADLALAVVWAIKHYRPYLEDRPFTLRTDSKALTWLQQFREARSKLMRWSLLLQEFQYSEQFREARSKLMRWSLLLQEFQYSVEHIPGRENQLPDALSQNPRSDLTTGDPTTTHPHRPQADSRPTSLRKKSPYST